MGLGRRDVSIHARTGRATGSKRFLGLVGPFQFTRARGARLPSVSMRTARHCFNSRAHGARDSARTADSCSGQRFNSRAHGARDADITLRVASNQFQFTRARGARPLFPPQPPHNMNVSIHARTGRATNPAADERVVFPFQFTRARGARLATGIVEGEEGGFNSRAHGARDPLRSATSAPMAMFQFTRARGARPDAET